MKKIGIVLGLMGIAFGATLAALIGTRLSEQALSVVTGAACGVGALLPMIAVLFGMLIRRNEDVARERRNQANTHYPPVIVVAPPGNALPAGNQNWTANPYATFNAAGHPIGNIVRQFSIIGNDGEEIINDEHHQRW